MALHRVSVFIINETYYIQINECNIDQYQNKIPTNSTSWAIFQADGTLQNIDSPLLSENPSPEFEFYITVSASSPEYNKDLTDKITQYLSEKLRTTLTTLPKTSEQIYAERTAEKLNAFIDWPSEARWTVVNGCSIQIEYQSEFRGAYDFHGWITGDPEKKIKEFADNFFKKAPQLESFCQIQHEAKRLDIDINHRYYIKLSSTSLIKAIATGNITSSQTDALHADIKKEQVENIPKVVEKLNSLLEKYKCEKIKQSNWEYLNIFNLQIHYVAPEPDNNKFIEEFQREYPELFKLIEQVEIDDSWCHVSHGYAKAAITSPDRWKRVEAKGTLFRITDYAFVTQFLMLTKSSAPLVQSNNDDNKNPPIKPEEKKKRNTDFLNLPKDIETKISKMKAKSAEQSNINKILNNIIDELNTTYNKKSTDFYKHSRIITVNRLTSIKVNNIKELREILMAEYKAMTYLPSTNYNLEFQYQPSTVKIAILNAINQIDKLLPSAQSDCKKTKFQALKEYGVHLLLYYVSNRESSFYYKRIHKKDGTDALSPRIKEAGKLAHLLLSCKTAQDFENKFKTSALPAINKYTGCNSDLAKHLNFVISNFDELQKSNQLNNDFVHADKPGNHSKR